MDVRDGHHPGAVDQPPLEERELDGGGEVRRAPARDVDGRFEVNHVRPRASITIAAHSTARLGSGSGAGCRLATWSHRSHW
jgi:hypothetical protein